MTYLLITHNLAVARHITDQVAVMYLGRMVEVGPTETVMRRPAHPYTHALMSARGGLAGGARTVLTGEVPTLRQRPAGCEFHPRCPGVQARCRVEAPPERVVATGHKTRCHFPMRVAQ
jgi:peptide/nickel transport system ATP-binding protein